MALNPLFESTSPEKPSVLGISFAGDPTASLGAHLHNCDKVTETVTETRLTRDSCCILFLVVLLLL
jgi:hypothetical protein